MEKVSNWLNPLRMQEIIETDSKTSDKTLSKFLKMVTQATEKKEKDNVGWVCFSILELVKFEKGQMMKHVIKIGIGPIMSNTVPLIQKKVETRCGAKIQSCNFGDGSKNFFTEPIISTADLISVTPRIREKIDKPDGEKEIKEEIERAVEKLENAFKTFNGIFNAMMAM